MLNQKNLLYFILYWILYIGVIIQWVWEFDALSFVPDALLIIFALVTPQKGIFTEIRQYLGSWVIGVFVLFLVLGVGSSLMNMEDPMTILWSFRIYIRYFLLFYLAWGRFGPEDIRRVKNIIITCLNINIPFVVFERYVLGISGDYLGGTFAEGPAALMPVVIIGFLLLLGDFFQGRVSLGRIAYYFVGIFFFALAGEVKLLYFLVPLLCYASYVLMKKFSLTHIAILAVSAILFVPVMSFVLSFASYDQNYIERYTSIEGIREETTNTVSWGENTFNRSTSIPMALTIICKDTSHQLFGYGIGSGSISGRFAGRIGKQYAMTKYYYFATSYLLVETGIVGLVLFVLFHILLLRRFYMIYKEAEDEPVAKYWATVGILTIGVTFLFMWYNSNPIIDNYLYYLIWTVGLMGVMYRQNELMEGREGDTDLL